MKRKVIAVCSADWHIHNWKQFNEKGRRLRQDLNLFQFFSEICQKYDAPLLMPGDLFEKQKQLANKVITRSIKAYKKAFEDKGIDSFWISGNHDQEEINNLEHKSSSYLHAFDAAFKTFHLLDYTYIQRGHSQIFGIPYLTGNVGMKKLLRKFRRIPNPLGKTRILMIHTDLYGALDTDGREVGTTENIDENLKRFFEGFDIVICGHIHKPQIIVKGKVYMLGSPKHQNRGDIGCEMGYWLMYNDLTMKFVPITKYPKFIEIYEDETAPDKDNFYIPTPRAKSSIDIPGTTGFSAKTNRRKLVKNWAKATGTKNQSKIKVLTKLLNQSDE